MLFAQWKLVGCCLHLSLSWSASGGGQRVAGSETRRGNWSTLRGQSCRSPWAPRTGPERRARIWLPGSRTLLPTPQGFSNKPKDLEGPQWRGSWKGFTQTCTEPSTGHQTGPNTSFEGKAAVQTCFHLLVGAPLPCPITAGLVCLPACRPSRPHPFSFSFSLLIYSCPLLKEYLGCPSPLWAEAWGLLHQNCPSTCGQGSAKVGQFTFSSRYFPRIIFNLWTAPIPTNLCPKGQKPGSPGASRRVLCSQPLLHRELPEFRLPLEQTNQKARIKGNVITPCLVHWTTEAWLCFPGLFFFTLNKTQFPLPGLQPHTCFCSPQLHQHHPDINADTGCSSQKEKKLLPELSLMKCYPKWISRYISKPLLFPWGHTDTILVCLYFQPSSSSSNSLSPPTPILYYSSSVLF